MSRLAATIEFRPLAYFVHVLQGQGLNAAADSLGVAHSTLSAAVQKLETATGLTLFGRQQGRAYPTDNALWLFRHALLLLHLEEYARQRRAATDHMEWISVELPLRFMAGRLTCAISHATRATMAAFPSVLIWPQFLSGFSPALYDAQTRDALRERSQWRPDGEPAGVVRLLHSESSTGGGAGIHLYDDRWVALTRRKVETAAAGGRQMSAAELSRKVVSVPSLPRVLLRHIAKYCRAERIHVSRWSGGLLELLGDRTSIGEICVLLPRSVVASRIADLPVVIHDLAPPLVSSLRARVVRGHPAAEEFLVQLRRSIGGTVPPIEFDPQITLRQLRYFDRLRTSASLSDAARRLCVVQPALTVQLKGLEREAGAQLVERHGRSAQRLRMTSDGQQLATISAWTLSTVDDMERQLAAWSRRRARHLRLGVSLGLGALPTIALGLARATEEVQQRYPMLSVELIEARHQELVTMLHQRTLQIALLELRAPNVRQTPLLAWDRLVLVCAKDSELAPSGSVTLAELRHLRLVLPRRGGAVRMLLDEASAAEGFQLAPHLECDSVVLALRHVLLLGLAAVVTTAEAEAIGNDREFEVHPIEHQHLKRRVTLAAARGEPLRDVERAMTVALRGSLSTAAAS